MARTPQEIFQHHAEALGAGDLDAIVADYTEDAVVITPERVYRGRSEIRDAFVALLTDLPEAKWDVPTVAFEGDVLFFEWTAVSATTRTLDGVDTIVFSADGIRAQTARYSLEHTS